MAFQTVFKRYELKYMLTFEQKEKILEAISPYMQLDKYGRTTIRNIYFDTDSYRLIRRSIEKPAYKEKLRMREARRSTKRLRSPFPRILIIRVRLRIFLQNIPRKTSWSRSILPIWAVCSALHTT